MIDKEKLLQIVELYRNSRNISQKRDLDPILAKVEKEGYKSSQIFASIGEDAAAIQVNLNSKELILLSTDAILPEFIRKSPYAAGFSAVYVGLDDIYACGGEPMALSVTIEYGDNEVGNQILQGVLDATQLFKIPLIRGHTVTDSLAFSLTSTTLGRTLISDFISIKNIQTDDLLYLVIDPKGQPGERNRLYWNTILNANEPLFKEKRAWIRDCYRKGLIHSCKDISNGGILGTIYQILRFSQVGVQVDIASFEEVFLISKSIYTFEEFIFAYLTSSFLITGPESKRNELLGNVRKSDMEIYPIGKIIPNGFVLSFNNEFFHLT